MFPGKKDKKTRSRGIFSFTNSPRKPARKTKDVPPPIFTTCVVWLEKNGLTTPNILKASAGYKEIQQHIKSFEKGKDLILSKDMDAHVVAGVLKCWICELPEPLFSYDLYEPLVTAQGVTNVGIRNEQLRKIFSLLPPRNKIMSTRFLHLLHGLYLNRKSNNVTSQMLAMIFTPALLREKEEDLQKLLTNAELTRSLVKGLIEEFTEFFGPYEPLVDPNEPSDMPIVAGESVEVKNFKDILANPIAIAHFKLWLDQENNTAGKAQLEFLMLAKVYKESGEESVRKQQSKKMYEKYLKGPNNVFPNEIRTAVIKKLVSDDTAVDLFDEPFAHVFSTLESSQYKPFSRSEIFVALTGGVGEEDGDDVVQRDLPECVSSLHNVLDSPLALFTFKDFLKRTKQDMDLWTAAQFWGDVKQYKELAPAKRLAKARGLHQKFLHPPGSFVVGKTGDDSLPSSVKAVVDSGTSDPDTTIFDSAQSAMFDVLDSSQVYSEFLESEKFEQFLERIRKTEEKFAPRPDDEKYKDENYDPSNEAKQAASAAVQGATTGAAATASPVAPTERPLSVALAELPACVSSLVRLLDSPLALYSMKMFCKTESPDSVRLLDFFSNTAKISQASRPDAKARAATDVVKKFMTEGSPNHISSFTEAHSGPAKQWIAEGSSPDKADISLFNAARESLLPDLETNAYRPYLKSPKCKEFIDRLKKNEEKFSRPQEEVVIPPTPGSEAKVQARPAGPIEPTLFPNKPAPSSTSANSLPSPSPDPSSPKSSSSCDPATSSEGKNEESSSSLGEKEDAQATSQKESQSTSQDTTSPSPLSQGGAESSTTSVSTSNNPPTTENTLEPSDNTSSSPPSHTASPALRHANSSGTLEDTPEKRKRVLETTASLLASKGARKAFEEYLRVQLCSENLACYDAINLYENAMTKAEKDTKLNDIYQLYVAQGAEYQIKLEGDKFKDALDAESLPAIKGTIQQLLETQRLAFLASDHAAKFISGEVKKVKNLVSFFVDAQHQSRT